MLPPMSPTVDFIVGMIWLVTPDTPVEEAFPRLASEHRETAVVILEGMGQASAAKSLRAADMSYVYAQYDNWDGGTDIFDAHLTVDASRLGDYSEAITDQIRDALRKVVNPIRGIWIGQIVTVPKVTTAKAPSNQALDPRSAPSQFQRQGMWFRSQAEVVMFDALVRKQADLRKGDTILIVPLPSVWNGRQRWEPDFIVTYRGRAGVIEIDDPTHHKRYVADKSRDQVLEECGIHVVRRIAVEDAMDDRQRTEFIETFLDRLTSR